MNTDYPNTKFQNQLAALNACGPARAWVGGRTLRQAWTECQHAGWMAWLATRVLPRKTAVAALVAAYASADDADAASKRMAARLRKCVTVAQLARALRSAT